MQIIRRAFLIEVELTVDVIHVMHHQIHRQHRIPRFDRVDQLGVFIVRAVRAVAAFQQCGAQVQRRFQVDRQYAAPRRFGHLGNGLVACCCPGC